jgi:signal transduction histidine kinase
MILAMNLLVVALALAVGYLAAEVAAEVVEDRLVNDMVSNAAGVVEDTRLPLTDTLMGRLSDIFGVPAAATDDRGRLVACSLPPDETDELRRKLPGVASGGTVALGGGAYRVSSHEVIRREEPGGLPRGRRLLLLVPEAQVQAARDKASGRIAALLVPAIALATLLAVALSMTITRPIRKLVGEMDRLAAEASRPREAEAAAAREAGSRSGPSEVVRLAEAFDHLLGELRSAQEELARSERLAAIGKLSVSVAHELKNPLSGIQMNVRVLQDQLAERGAADESLTLILREIERMDLYLQELMALAGGPRRREDEAAGRAPDMRRLRFEEVADSVLPLLAGRCRHAGVSIEQDHAPDAPAFRADPTQVRQVIMNLLINAIEAMPAGGTVRLRSRAAPGGMVRLSVADSGEGIRRDGDADIFDPFVTTKSEGAGLGLYVCRQIATRHGGRIGYESTDRGATFWFELPAA